MWVGGRAFSRCKSPGLNRTARRSKRVAWFYEIRDSNNVKLKRDGGFPTQAAAEIAGRADAKKIKNTHQPGRRDVGTILVGQNAEQPTR